ncbi:ferritin-like domain-containing protein [Flavobacterium sp. CBA20B-1]|uniref:ferritin-like domain-containing protein n=1 Tax=unclassified Flavobacterium TaxID=196869 RepID=UPI002224D82C|nr:MULTISPECIES: ferritin-like domain-containing protein [unclassified Flavobacterium]WCM41680.1 ferritin-like domain-containing protein [Flavobacterium sp. CBA20B-1]
MNLLKILNKLSDDQFYTKQASRLDALTGMTDIGTKAAIAALPLGLGSLFTTTAQTKNNATTAPNAFAAGVLTDALQLALTLEYLEDEYYRMGLDAGGLIPSADRTVFMQIAKHETAHVAFLKAALTSLGETPVAKPTFDFTAGGNFNPFTDYNQFLILAQAFEDTGVRAYKGQAGNVMGNKQILQAALQIHSVEARHASQVRRMRNNKGWIELDNGGNMPAATNAVYAGEENITQAGFNTANAFGAAAGSAAYDEVLSGSDADTIAGLFIV